MAIWVTFLFHFFIHFSYSSISKHFSIKIFLFSVIAHGYQNQVRFAWKTFKVHEDSHIWLLEKLILSNLDISITAEPCQDLGSYEKHIQQPFTKPIYKSTSLSENRVKYRDHFLQLYVLNKWSKSNFVLP